jgi:uncharacterized protein YegP (UPF0339 family)
MPVSYPCYWKKKDNSGYWYWTYYAANGKAIARSCESYNHRSDCYHSITLLQASGNDPVFYTE